MAAPSFHFPLAETPVQADLAAEANLARVRAAAMVARDRLAEIPHVRVIGPEVASNSAVDGVRLAIDLRDTGRDAWQVACSMAGRGYTLEAATNRVIIVRMREEDVEEGLHERLAPALLIALWSTPFTGAARDGSE